MQNREQYTPKNDTRFKSGIFSVSLPRQQAFLRALGTWTIVFCVGAAETTLALAKTQNSPSVAPAPAIAASVSCAPDASTLAQITKIQNDPTLSYLDEIKRELAVRRAFLSQTILCAKTEAESLQTSLIRTNTDPSVKDLQAQLSEKLNAALTYYDLELAKVNTTGINGTQAIAREIIVWRSSNYAPLAENVSNFILWSENQPLFETVQARLDQVSSIVNSLPFSENTELRNDFQKASASFHDAQDLNAQAKTAFAEGISPDQTLALIQQSLSALGDTYQHFFDISTLTQTLLPH